MYFRSINRTYRRQPSSLSCFRVFAQQRRLSLPFRPKPKQLLEVDLSQGGSALADTDQKQAFSQPKTPFFRAIKALRKAAFDDQILGVSFLLGQSLTISDVEELRKIIELFKSRQKATSVFAEGYSADWNYYLASCFENVWMLPTGHFHLAPHLEQKATTHWKAPLKSIGVDVDFIRKKDYKASSLVNFFESQQSPQQKEEYQKIFLDGWIAQSRRHIAADRKISEEVIQSIADKGMSSAKEVLKLNLITRAGYQDEALIDLFTKVGIDASSLKTAKDRSKYLISLSQYIKNSEKEEMGEVSPSIIKRFFFLKSKPQVVGVIPLGGDITSYPVPLRSGIDSHTVKKVIRQAAEDPLVKSIVIRCNSGGGSALASDIIGHEIENAKLKGKPVVFSMGLVCGSGGYWIAAPATTILADESTITGSIGVFIPRTSIHSLLTEKLGVSLDYSPGKSPSSNFGRVITPLTEEHHEIINRLTEEIYQSFKEHVSKHRNISIEDMEHLAQGKIYTGHSALEAKLVDQLGGYLDALRVGAELGHIPLKDGLPLMKVFPKSNPTARIQKLLRRGSGKKTSEDLSVVSPDSLSDLGAQVLQNSIYQLVDSSVLMPLNRYLNLHGEITTPFADVIHRN